MHCKTRTPPPNPSIFFLVQPYSKNLNYIFLWFPLSPLLADMSRLPSSLYFRFVRHPTWAHLSLLLESLGTTGTCVAATTPTDSAQGHVATEQTPAQTIWNNTGHFCLPAASCSSHRTVLKASTPMNYKTIQKKLTFCRLSFAAVSPIQKSLHQGLVIMSQAEGWSELPC